MKEASAALEEKTQHQAAVQARLEEENQRLEERANSQSRQRHRDQDAQAELQAALRKMTSSSDELTRQLADAERSNRELQKGSAELQAKLVVAREEKAALGQQLQLVREVHQKEVLNLKAAAEGSKTKKEREVQETLELCRRERDETRAHLSEVKVRTTQESPAFLLCSDGNVHTASEQSSLSFIQFGLCKTMHFFSLSLHFLPCAHETVCAAVEHPTHIGV